MEYGDVGAAVGQGLVAGSDWFQWYPVRPKDTLPEIGRWWYGRRQEKWWRRIWLANRRTIGENPNNRLERGEWLKLPYRGFSYHVAQDDTLQKLAGWVYGDETKFERIHDENPWIKDPEDLEDSWWIWIP